MDAALEGVSLVPLLPLLLSLLAAPLVVLVGAIRQRWTAPAAVLITGVAFAATIWATVSGGGAVQIPWALSWDLYFSLAFDGLGALFALLATGIGFAITIYSWAYIPRHLEHEERPRNAEIPYYGFLLLFMGSMVGLALALDLILLFIFWDLTAIASYFLIGFDRTKGEAREAALMAFLVTGITSVLFLVGALILQVVYQSFSLPHLYQQAEPNLITSAACGLIIIAALAKSAQIPFHFWLPRAMAAPTPVSAYLHSAAMVAAGILLLSRVHSLLQELPYLLDALIIVGLLSIAVGGLLALVQEELKRVLAYSTISQYGYMVVLLGIGGESGVGAALFYLLAHAPIKSALFLTAGAVSEVTGETRLSQIGGLARHRPGLAFGSAAAASGLAALPFTIGFFKDELLFKAALKHGPILSILLVIGAALSFAYTWRFWSGIFLGDSAGQRRPISAWLTGPVVILGLVVLAGGLFVTPFSRLAEAAASSAWRDSVSLEPAYHLDTRPENLMALAAYGLGMLILLAGPVRNRVVQLVSSGGRSIGPEHLYTILLGGLNELSTRAYKRVRVLRLGDRIIAMLVPSAFLLVLGLWARGVEGTYHAGAFSLRADLPLLLALILTAGATVTLAFPRNHLTQVLALTAVNYSLAAFFTFFGAPDVALVMVLISTISSLFFLGIFVLLPENVLTRQVDRPPRGWLHRRHLVTAFISGVFALVVAWGVLSQSPPRPTVALEQIRLTPEVHAGDVVTAILADFRGLDTMGEISVLAIALAGVVQLLRRRQL